MESRLLLFALVIVTISFHRAQSLSCLPCWERQCDPAPTNCAFGLTKDVCGCCEICANGLGDPCQGPFNILGTCGKGLKCELKVDNSKPYVLEALEGICISSEVKPAPKPLVNTRPKAHPLPFALRNYQPQQKEPQVNVVYNGNNYRAATRRRMSDARYVPARGNYSRTYRRPAAYQQPREIPARKLYVYE